MTNSVMPIALNRSTTDSSDALPFQMSNGPKLVNERRSDVGSRSIARHSSSQLPVLSGRGFENLDGIVDDRAVRVPYVGAFGADPKHRGRLASGDDGGTGPLD